VCLGLRRRLFGLWELCGRRLRRGKEAVGVCVMPRNRRMIFRLFCPCHGSDVEAWIESMRSVESRPNLIKIFDPDLSGNHRLISMTNDDHACGRIQAMRRIMRNQISLSSSGNYKRRRPFPHSSATFSTKNALYKLHPVDSCRRCHDCHCHEH
jgi:hypothetical protein